ncbi:MAG TPA: B-box zinc finger protein [Acidobacteriaceae bacterium]|nr:B-box zinc finger protein [Acidobacteriaceae bacterium]
MNCAHHPDRERSAFCQNCGKPLCAECVRNVGTSIFCEPCLLARVAGAPPRAGYGYPVYPAGATPGAPGEPNPSIAAILGLIPGVGAMYNGQYAKGIVHLIVFVVLVSLTHDADGIFVLFVFGWIAYMAIEAHHTARARRDGTPLPNPFGMNDLSERLGFGKAWPGAGPVDPSASSAPNVPPASPYTPPPGYPNAPPINPYAPPYDYRYTYVPPVSQWGAPQAPGVPPMQPPYSDPASAPPTDFSQRFPSGAIWLIALGVLFLIGRSSIFHFRAHVFAPILMIGFGVWLFVSRMMSTGHGLQDDGTQYYRWRIAHAVHSSMWIVLTGVIWLLDALHIFSWSRSWPLYLIGAGVLMVFRHTGEAFYAPYAAPPAVYPPASGPDATEKVTSLGLSRNEPSSGLHTPTQHDDQEGR